MNSKDDYNENQSRSHWNAIGFDSLGALLAEYGYDHGYTLSPDSLKYNAGLYG